MVLRCKETQADTDVRELSQNQNLNVSCNRFGGDDLRVFRDNFDALAQKALNDNGKRTSSEDAKTDGSSSAASCSRSKRIRSKQRLDELQRDINDAEEKQSHDGSEMMRLLLFFRRTKADADERCRRDGREERLGYEKRERAQREEPRNASCKINRKHESVGKNNAEKMRHLNNESSYNAKKTNTVSKNDLLVTVLKLANDTSR
ncbi:LOW QUALITY PROTEIN: hypothetical protein PHMEG_00019589 [Phytophthora megakarya]|uniref:Uncharacterized protein n=1 Tax=Phytophthora megakarya TaxID=4795 RepID=A0A225VRJ9_9STRA|nr:LOW QUALITY PROTEIN: hypothetical protein PHMEG_00019589 [Phytophthora megakarya]